MKFSIFLILFIITIIISSANGKFVKLDKERKFKFEFSINEKEKMINFEVFLPTPGFIAIAFGENMFFTDMLIAQWNNKNTNDKNNTVNVNDFFSRGTVRPKPDTEYGGKNDVIIVDQKQDENGVKIVFKRPFLTEDKNLDKQFKENEKVIASVGWVNSEKGLSFHNGNIVKFYFEVKENTINDEVEYYDDKIN